MSTDDKKELVISSALIGKAVNDVLEMLTGEERDFVLVLMTGDDESVVVANTNVNLGCAARAILHMDEMQNKGKQPDSTTH